MRVKYKDFGLRFFLEYNGMLERRCFTINKCNRETLHLKIQAEVWTGSTIHIGEPTLV